MLRNWGEADPASGNAVARNGCGSGLVASKGCPKWQKMRDMRVIHFGASSKGPFGAVAKPTNRQFAARIAVGGACHKIGLAYRAILATCEDLALLAT